MVVRDIKASWKKKNRSKSTIENGIIKWKKIKIFYKQRMVFSHIKDKEISCTSIKSISNWFLK